LHGINVEQISICFAAIAEKWHLHIRNEERASRKYVYVIIREISFYSDA
jgi:hypothetical protein